MAVCLYSVYLTLIFVMLVGIVSIILGAAWGNDNLLTIVLFYAVTMFVVVILFPVLLSIFTGMAC